MFRSVLALSLLTASVFSAASDQATQVESLPLYYTDKGHADSQQAQYLGNQERSFEHRHRARQDTATLRDP